MKWVEREEIKILHVIPMDFLEREGGYLDRRLRSKGFGKISGLRHGFLAGRRLRIAQGIGKILQLLQRYIHSFISMFIFNTWYLLKVVL